MIENVAITADSTCDLSPDLIARYGIRIIPLHVTMGEDTYTDGVDLSAPQIFDYVSKTGQHLRICRSFFFFGFVGQAGDPYQYRFPVF